MTMREKIARAICLEVQGHDFGSFADDGTGDFITTVTQLIDLENAVHRAADAVLSVLADTTPEMVEAGITAALEAEGVDRRDLTGRDIEKATRVVTAAITAAIRAAANGEKKND